MNDTWSRVPWAWQPAAMALVLLAADTVDALPTAALLLLALVASRFGPRPSLVLGLLAVACLPTAARPAGLLFAAAAVVAAGLDRREAALLGVPGVVAFAAVLADRGPTARLTSLGIALVVGAVIVAVRPTPSAPLRGPRVLWLAPAAALLVAADQVPGDTGRLLDDYAIGALRAVAAAGVALAARGVLWSIPSVSSTMGGPPEPAGSTSDGHSDDDTSGAARSAAQG